MKITAPAISGSASKPQEYYRASSRGRRQGCCRVELEATITAAALVARVGGMRWRRRSPVNVVAAGIRIYIWIQNIQIQI